jgi:HKD family nuclease
MIHAYQPSIEQKKTSLESDLKQLIKKTDAGTIQVATAYLSMYGADFITKMAQSLGGSGHRAIVGISQRVTQPEAIHKLIDAGIDVRLGVVSSGIFHPKLLVGLKKLGRIAQPVCSYIGSANITYGGLRKNSECAECSDEIAIAARAHDALSIFWNSAHKTTKRALTEYEKRYALGLKERSATDLRDLGVELERIATPGTGMRTKVPVVERSTVVWVGLQSFTGDYDLQVEFPRLAGEAFLNIANPKNRKATVICGDGTKRSLIFDYYKSNSMYRLNLPNDLPLVPWVRAQRNGYLVISKESATNTVRAEILKPRQITELKEKSRVLGTLGETSTRQYGWF